jgi:hypothetical protein
VTVSNVTADVILAWDANTDPFVTGYKVYVGDSSGLYSQSFDVGHTATCTLTGLRVGRLYYFAVTAYGQNGRESAFSSEVSALTAIGAAVSLVVPVSSWSGTSVDDDVDLGFVEPSAAASRTLPGLGQFVFTERESARATPRRFDRDTVARGARRSNQMTQVVFDISTLQAELTRERRDRAGTSRQNLE